MNTQALLRRDFKRALRKNDTSAFFMTLSRTDIAHLSAGQALKLVRFTGTDAFAACDGTERDAFTDSLAAGLLRNEDMRSWYYNQLNMAKKMARFDNPYVWSGKHPHNLQQRLHDAYCEVQKEEELEDFFSVLRLLQRGVDNQLEDAGMRRLPHWARDRFMKGLFPRMRELRKEFRLCGRPEPLLAFRGRVQNAAAKLPAYMRDFLVSTGYTFRLGARLGSIDARYATEPAIYARGTVEQNACGIHVRDTFHIDLPLYRVPKTAGEPAALAHTHMDDLRLTVGHEAGHGVVMALDRFIDLDERLQHAYKTDIDALLSSDENAQAVERNGYFLPQSHRGRHENIVVAREEALVEIMSELMGHETGLLCGELCLEMPETTKIAITLLETIKAQYDINPTGTEFPDVALLDSITCRRFDIAAAGLHYRLRF